MPKRSYVIYNRKPFSFIENDLLLKPELCQCNLDTSGFAIEASVVTESGQGRQRESQPNTEEVQNVQGI